MATFDASRRAGEFADARFRAHRRAWRKRIWWALPAAGALPGLAGLLGGLLLEGEAFGFYGGIGIGAAFALALALADSPPQRIEKWRRGAEGERATAKALRRLERQGWTLIHDIDAGRGNFDHILIGRSGVFLLETKNLSGKLTVKGGVLTITSPEDPSEQYDDRRMAGRTRVAAVLLARALRTQSACVWVQPTIVLWGDFEQRSVLSDGVAWIAGKHLADVIEARPAMLDAEAVATASGRLRAALSELATVNDH